jgi:hydroxymethylpyrimidine/phosphomethylpyrimidine kinase
LTDKTPVALTIAGSDSGAGAGIQADLKTFAALGVYGVSAITAVTAQNTLGVRAVFNLPPEIVAAQIDAIFDDFNVAAVKIGMLGDLAIVETVAAALVRRRPRFVVFDPVMIASSGDPLVAPEAMGAMKTRLLPAVDCVTPNLAEAGELLNSEIAGDEMTMIAQGRALLKGGHLESAEVVDLLVTDRGARRYVGPRAVTRNLHGTGCTLSAALAAQTVLGRELEEAVGLAKSFVFDAIVAGCNLTLGSGAGPLVQRPQAP